MAERWTGFQINLRHSPFERRSRPAYRLSLKDIARLIGSGARNRVAPQAVPEIGGACQDFYTSS